MHASGGDWGTHWMSVSGVQTVASFPSSDRAFARVLRALILRLRPRNPFELEKALRRTYPMAVVRVRDLAGEPHPVWYVYRDGSALARWAVGRWWETASSVALFRIGPDGLFLEFNDAADALLGTTPGALIGHPYTELALEGDAAALELMWDALALFGQLDSVYTIRRPDGRPVTVEGHAESTADGVVVYIRPIKLMRTDG